MVFSKREIFTSWVITIFLAVLIFYVSSLSFAPSSSSNTGYKAIVYHMTIFFFLAFFLSVSLTKGKNSKLIILSMVICLIYAFLDEFHQSFVPGRNSSLGDVFIDGVGIIISSVIIAIKINDPDRIPEGS